MRAAQRLRQFKPLARIFERREDRLQNLIAAQLTLAVSGRSIEDTLEGPPILVEDPMIQRQTLPLKAQLKSKLLQEGRFSVVRCLQHIIKMAVDAALLTR